MTKEELDTLTMDERATLIVDLLSHSNRPAKILNYSDDFNSTAFIELSSNYNIEIHPDGKMELNQNTVDDHGNVNCIMLNYETYDIIEMTKMSYLRTSQEVI